LSEPPQPAISRVARHSVANKARIFFITRTSFQILFYLIFK
jgi:hypothetical protein